MEAAPILAALEEQGIRAIQVGDATAGFRAEAPGYIQVLVAEEDASRARDVLEHVRRELSDIDWSQIEVGEPED